MPDTSLRPFHVEIPQSDLDELHRRLRRTLWPDDLPTAYGVTNERVRALAERWLERFDWRAVEARLNAYPQFLTEIDGETIHFLHIRSKEPGAFPLILTHGWPSTIFEFIDVIGPLTDPRAHGLDPKLSFDLVIP